MQPLKNEFPAKMLFGILQKVDHVEHRDHASDDLGTHTLVGIDVDDLKLITQTVYLAPLKFCRPELLLDMVEAEDPIGSDTTVVRKQPPVHLNPHATL